MLLVNCFADSLAWRIHIYYYLYGVAKMKVQEVDGVIIISSEEMLDIVHGQKLKDTVEELRPKGGLKLVVDMGETVFIDSKGCGVLLALLKMAIKQRGDTKIARPTHTVLGILQLSRLDKVFGIYDSVENAKKSFIQSEYASSTKGRLSIILDNSIKEVVGF
jgi:anti-sigma B factor antagonist